MQFAMPPRKNSRPSDRSPFSAPFNVHPRFSPAARRRRQLRSYAIFGLSAFFLLFIITRLFGWSPSSSSAWSSSSSPSAENGVSTGENARVVIVTVLDEATLPDRYIQQIKQNREDYAKRHGYVNFFASTSEYGHLLDNSPRSWANVPAVRHALSLYPRATHFFHLSPRALIMNPSLSLTSHVLSKSRLESLMLRDTSVVPPDSVIKTFKHISGKDVDLVVSQDREDLCSDSYILKNSEWAKFFLDAWFDPLYRSYKFAKAEKHALDHVIQWHPTMLARMALIPQRMLNSYSTKAPIPSANGVYQEGDFVINFMGCDRPNSKDRNCEAEMRPYYLQWAQNTGNRPL